MLSKLLEWGKAVFSHLCLHVCMPCLHPQAFLRKTVGAKDAGQDEQHTELRVSLAAYTEIFLQQVLHMLQAC